MNIVWLVVSTQLKHISQIGHLPQVGVNIKNIWNHHQVVYSNCIAPHKHETTSALPNQEHIFMF